MKKQQIVIVADDKKSISCNSQFEREPIPFTNIHENFFDNKWVCKGKHQYRQTKTECGDTYWTCQCGKSLTSKS